MWCIVCLLIEKLRLKSPRLHIFDEKISSECTAFRHLFQFVFTSFQSFNRLLLTNGRSEYYKFLNFPPIKFNKLDVRRSSRQPVSAKITEIAQKILSKCTAFRHLFLESAVEEVFSYLHMAVQILKILTLFFN